jgi:phospholipid-binding lipoprotein MlaA
MNKLAPRQGKKITTTLALLVSVLLLSACATTKTGPISKADPYEDVNRGVHEFNDTVDSYVAKPISDTYKWITPQFVQTGIFNFFNNLKNVDVIINDVLQAKFEQGAEDTGRLIINTTAGLGGLIDVAQEVGLKQNDEDFDQTLAVWGVPTGPYLVIPLLGPTTVRGIPGAIFDTLASPTTYVGMPVQLVAMLNARANAQTSLDFVKEGAVDPYVFIREGFLQNREHLATDGKSQHHDIDLDFDDDSSDKKSKVADKSKHTLRLSSNEAFDNAMQSFDVASKAFADADAKMTKLKQEKAAESKKSTK